MEEESEDTQNPENLPEEINIPLFPKPLNNLTIDSDLVDFQKEDLQIANTMLAAVHDCWKHVKSLRSLTAMVDTTIKATAHRRAVLGKQYGAKSEAAPAKGGSWVPD